MAYRGGGNVLLSGSAGDAAGFRNGNEKLDRYDVIGLHEAGERSSIGFLRESNIKPFLNTFALEAAPLSDAWAKRELKIACLHGATLEPAAKSFLDFLRKATA